MNQTNDISGNRNRDSINPTNINNILNDVISELLNDFDDEVENPSVFNPILLHNNRIQRSNFTIGRNIERGSSLYNMVNQLFDTSLNSFIGNNRDNRDNRENNNSISDQNNQNDDDHGETENDSAIIEEVTFHITYPINLNQQTRNSNVNLEHGEENINFHDIFGSSTWDCPEQLLQPPHQQSQQQQQEQQPISAGGSEMNPTNESRFSNSNSNSISNYRRNIFNHLLHRSYFSPTQTFPTNAFERILTQSLYDENVYKKKISDKGKLELCHTKFNKDDTVNLNTSCPIMQTDFEEDEYIIRLPCNHSFTPSAINKWLDEKPECPVCRYELDSIEVRREQNIIHQNNLMNFNNMNDMNNLRYISYYTPRNHENQINNTINENVNNSSARYERIWDPMYNRWYYYREETGDSTWFLPDGESWFERLSTNNQSLPHENREIRQRINITPQSYIDYIYNEIDNDDDDFQRALILSYREIVTNPNNNTDNEEEKNETINDTQPIISSTANIISNSISSTSSYEYSSDNFDEETDDE